MREAIEIARRGLDSVSPNPMVGAVVARGGRVIGRGWHRRFGGPHAEIEALRDAVNARGADLYVSLEPCAHHGKTPPCTDAILAAGIRRVFFAAADPNPLTRGSGPRLLRRQGVEVRGGILRSEGRELNAPYFHWRETGRPWVILKWAMSLDGKTATATGESRWISGPQSRSFAHALRRRVDAVLVGTRTALADDPLLTPRPARGRSPWRIVLDRRGRLPLDLRFLAREPRRAGRGPRLCVVGPSASAARRRELERRGVGVLELDQRRGRLDLSALLEELGSRGISQLLVEGGGDLAGSFLDERLVDEVVAFVSPQLLGGRAAPTAVGGRGARRLAESLRLARVEVSRLGEDLVLQGTVER
jgi:diaminohydroxyphosphoribosylaminopyrimidine deaminase/5-amino-6-(5-phosphoribosylamino)uracil reductase